ncbi:MAG: aspartate/glutamate racemase family protein [Pseudomonadota bacterium]
MKTIGILGGMSAASTQLYYQYLCEMTQSRLGGLHSPDLIIRSVDFAEIEHLQMSNQWNRAGEILNHDAKRLEHAGADMIILATNTMHKLAANIMQDVAIPFIHIATATAEAITAASYERPGLMATAFTMEQTFYTDVLKDAGLTPVVPNPEDRAQTHRIIYDELCKGVMHETSRNTYIQIADRLRKSGADCLILGCTEVGMLLNPDNAPLPVFDTTRIHCEAALNFALDQST